MAHDKPAEKPDERTAQHSGEDRDHGKPEPGSGLERRQQRNAEGTESSGGAGGADNPKRRPDPANP